MKLGNRDILSAKLNEHFGFACYTDDNEIVAMNGDGSTIAFLRPLAEGWLTIYSGSTGAVLANIEVPGAGFEDHELSPAATRQ